MKKILLVLAIGAIVASCNNAAEKAPETTPEVTTPEVTTPAPDTTVKVDTSAAPKVDTTKK
jgi:cytochrome c5